MLGWIVRIVVESYWDTQFQVKLLTDANGIKLIFLSQFFIVFWIMIRSLRDPIAILAWIGRLGIMVSSWVAPLAGWKMKKRIHDTRGSESVFFDLENLLFRHPPDHLLFLLHILWQVFVHACSRIRYPQMICHGVCRSVTEWLLSLHTDWNISFSLFLFLLSWHRLAFFANNANRSEYLFRLHYSVKLCLSSRSNLSYFVILFCHPIDFIKVFHAIRRWSEWLHFLFD